MIAFACHSDAPSVYGAVVTIDRCTIHRIFVGFASRTTHARNEDEGSKERIS